MEENEIMVQDIYSGVLDIVKFLKGERLNEFVGFMLDESVRTYEEKGVSPIIEQEKFDGFSVDYYFLVGCLARYAGNSVPDNLSGNLEASIKLDFGQREGHMRNGRLIVLALDILGVTIFKIYKGFMYTKVCYLNEQSNTYFAISGISFKRDFLEDNFSEKMNSLKRVANKKENKLLGFGPRTFTKMLMDHSGGKDKLFLFKA